MSKFSQQCSQAVPTPNNTNSKVLILFVGLGHIAVMRRMRKWDHGDAAHCPHRSKQFVCKGPIVTHKKLFCSPIQAATPLTGLKRRTTQFWVQNRKIRMQNGQTFTIQIFKICRLNQKGFSKMAKLLSDEAFQKLLFDLFCVWHDVQVNLWKFKKLEFTHFRGTTIRQSRTRRRKKWQRFEMENFEKFFEFFV